MKSIVSDIFNFYDEINNGKFKWIKSELESANIRILSDFINNRSNIEKFYNTYVVPNNPKVVICGINPGRLGAGKTGVPFLDFASLSKLISGIRKGDSEASARYFYSIVEHFGKEVFYSNFYVTNISWLGFCTNGKIPKNVNYYDLPEKVQDVIIDIFIEEMNLVNPTHIIPCSEQVLNTLSYLKRQKKISANIEIKLKHPYYCSIKTHTPVQYKNYIETLGELI